MKIKLTKKQAGDAILAWIEHLKDPTIALTIEMSHALHAVMDAVKWTYNNEDFVDDERWDRLCDYLVGTDQTAMRQRERWLELRKMKLKVEIEKMKLLEAELKIVECELEENTTMCKQIEKAWEAAKNERKKD